MATRKEVEKALEKATAEQLKQICRDEGFSGYTGLKVDDLRDLVVENRLRVRAESLLKSSDCSHHEVLLALKELLKPTLVKMASERGAKAKDTGNKDACIAIIMAERNGASAAAPVPAPAPQAVATCDVNNSNSSSSTSPGGGSVRIDLTGESDTDAGAGEDDDSADSVEGSSIDNFGSGAQGGAGAGAKPPSTWPSVGGDNDVVRDKHLRMLSISQLNNLAAALAIAPSDGAAAFTNKALAVSALSKKALNKQLPPDMRATIVEKAQEDKAKAEQARAKKAAGEASTAARESSASSGDGNSSTGDATPSAAPVTTSSSAPPPPPAVPAPVNVNINFAVPAPTLIAPAPSPVPVTPVPPSPSPSPTTVAAFAAPAPAAAAAVAAAEVISVVAKYRLEALSLAQLNALAVDLRIVAPTAGAGAIGGGFTSKAAAVAALSGRVQERLLTSEMKETITLKRAAEAARKAAAASSSSSSSLASTTVTANSTTTSGSGSSTVIASVPAPAAPANVMTTAAPAPSPPSPPQPAPLNPSAPVPGDVIVADAQLQVLAHLQLTRLALAVGVQPPGGAWTPNTGQAGKNDAVRALSGRVPARLLDAGAEQAIATFEKNAAVEYGHKQLRLLGDELLAFAKTRITIHAAVAASKRAFEAASSSNGSSSSSSSASSSSASSSSSSAGHKRGREDM